jgi:hypothetical protein
MWRIESVVGDTSEGKLGGGPAVVTPASVLEYFHVQISSLANIFTSAHLESTNSVQNKKIFLQL